MQPVTVEPIAVQVTRFLCPYCHRGRSSKRAAKLHMVKCWRNPDLRGCKTCAMFQTHAWPGKPAVGTKAPGRCNAGLNLAPGLVTKCRKWKPQPAARP